MKWKSANFESQSIAEKFKNSLEEKGIKTGEIFSARPNMLDPDKLCFYVPYLPIDEKQKKEAYELLEYYLFDYKGEKK